MNQLASMSGISRLWNEQWAVDAPTVEYVNFDLFHMESFIFRRIECTLSVIAAGPSNNTTYSTLGSNPLSSSGCHLDRLEFRSRKQ